MLQTVQQIMQLTRNLLSETVQNHPTNLISHQCLSVEIWSLFRFRLNAAVKKCNIFWNLKLYRIRKRFQSTYKGSIRLLCIENMGHRFKISSTLFLCTHFHYASVYICLFQLHTQITKILSMYNCTIYFSISPCILLQSILMC